MSIQKVLPGLSGQFGAAVTDLIHVARAGKAPVRNGREERPTSLLARADAASLDRSSRTPARRPDAPPEIAALAVAALGLGLRHLVSHRNGGCAFCAGADLRGAGQPALPVFAPHLYGQVGGHGGKRKKHRWLRRSVVVAAMAVTYVKARRVLDDNDRGQERRGLAARPAV